VSWLGIHGHDAVRDAFARAVERGRLGHSYLFVGPEGVGKKRFALALAKSISCMTPQGILAPCGSCAACVQVHAGTYADLHVVGLPEDKHEFPTELMAQLIERLAMKPTRPGARRIALVDDADAFNEETANRFLKTLEEPPPDSLLILLGTAAERQLATIRSRCQIIVFHPLGMADFTAATVEAGVVANPDEAQRVHDLADGSVTRARLLLEPDIKAFAADLTKAFTAPKFDSVGLGILLTKFADAAKESAQKRQRAHFAVDLLVSLFRQALHRAEEAAGPSPQPVVQKLAGLPSADGLLTMLEACVEAEQQIDRRFQLALILEILADRLGRVLRLAA
jgi:DNA polymerase-3 subunit delta'